jgi:plasmid stabilization system protein ParE
MAPYYRVILLPEVYDDIDRIIDYILPDSPQNAALVADRILAAAQSLSSLPKRHAVHQHRKDADKTVRAMTVWPFIIYYRILESHHAVKVLTVRHGARRQPRRFK